MGFLRAGTMRVNDRIFIPLQDGTRRVQVIYDLESEAKHQHVKLVTAETAEGKMVAFTVSRAIRPAEVLVGGIAVAADSAGTGT